MDTKLTLLIDSNIIECAKNYAKRENKSLSKLVGDYFSKLTNDSSHEIKISPLVKKLSKVVDLPEDYDHKKAYADHLVKKYSK